MQRYLCTPDYEGYFDFFSNIIVLSIYDSKHKEEILGAIQPQNGTTELSERQVEIRALLKHEITHFLDMTTTAWGCQYILRKLRTIKYLEEKGSEYEDAQKVFMLETSEIEMHTELLSTTDVPPMDCETLHHTLRYTTQFGAVLIVCYFRNDVCQHQVPLSMLSLLEANATASEYLSRISDTESLEDNALRILRLEDIERSFSALLNDPARLEYSVLLNLARVHFPELALRDLLIYVAALCRFSLDATDFGMAAMANIIEPSTLNQRLGNALAMELRRAANRPLLFFKTVLFTYGWMQEMGEENRSGYLELVRTNPKQAIRSLWIDYLEVGEDTLDLEREFTVPMKQAWIDELNVLGDAEIFKRSFASNAPKLNETSVGLLNFQEITAINIILGDDTEIEMPNRIDLGVVEYFDNHMKTFARLDAMYREQPHERFHIPLDAPGYLIR